MGVGGEAAPVLPARTVRKSVRGKVRVETVEFGLLNVVPMLELDEQSEEDSVQVCATHRQVACFC